MEKIFLLVGGDTIFLVILDAKSPEGALRALPKGFTVLDKGTVMTVRDPDGRHLKLREVPVVRAPSRRRNKKFSPGY